MMTDLGKAGAIFVRDARLAISYPIAFVLQWLGIAASVMSLWYVSRIVPPSGHFSYNGAVVSYFDFALINVAFLAFHTAALQSFERSIRDDQIFGTLESTFATATGAHVIVLASALWAFTITSINVVCYLCFGFAFGMHLNHIDLGASLLLLALTITATIPLGILSAGAVMVLKQGAPIQYLLNMAASVLAGVLFPVSLLPQWLQTVSWLLPATHALNGIRGALQGATIGQLWPDVCWLGIVSAVLLPLSLWAFDRAVRRAAYDGTLAQY
jgi:ABC-2 type transport system permease protein